MNILVTLDKNYMNYLGSLLNSINKNVDEKIDLFVISNDFVKEEFNKVYYNEKNTIKVIKFDERLLKDAPTTNRYPLSIYYRIFAAFVLPNNIDRILYLDTDIIVKGDLRQLYNMDFDNNLFIACSNVREFLRVFNALKNKAPRKSQYINTGVMLMNLKKLREEQDIQMVFQYIKKYNRRFILPDQDIINAFYGDKILLVDNKIYNFNDRVLRKQNKFKKSKIDEKWIENNVVVIHYLGRNKPWKDTYHGKLKHYYDKYSLK